MNDVSTIERSGKATPQAVNGVPTLEPRNSPLIPNDSGLLPGMDAPKAMKQLLEDEDVERYLQLEGRVR